jgi:hypothetical protein
MISKDTVTPTRVPSYHENTHVDTTKLKDIIVSLLETKKNFDSYKDPSIVEFNG